MNNTGLCLPFGVDITPKFQVRTKSVVKIDHLSFSGRFSCLEHLDSFKCSKVGFDWKMFERMPSPHLSRFASDSIIETPYDNLPCSTLVSTAETKNKRSAAEFYNNLRSAVLLSRLRALIFHFFGFTMGDVRGKGQYFYNDSFPLYAKNGSTDVLMGMVFFGGNKDTFFIQIHGAGCTDLMTRLDTLDIYSLFNHLSITTLRRLDLCYDDYEGNFSCQHAVSAMKDDAFYTSKRKGPKPEQGYGWRKDSSKYTYEMATSGSRSSTEYWRIYDKAAEQGVDTVWYRSEVELKKFTIDALLDLDGTFAGLNDWAASVISSAPVVHVRDRGLIEAINDIDAKVQWLRKQASNTIHKVINYCDGNVIDALGLILKGDSCASFNVPDQYNHLVKERMNLLCPF